MSENQDELLTVAELANLWRVTKGNIYRLTRDRRPGSIPRMRVGGKHIRFSKNEITVWAKKQAFKTA